MGYEAIIKGSPERIIYGLDSYGNYCGSVNGKPDGTEVDLRKARKLLYLNPLELLDSKNYQYASAVCVESCPTSSTICNSTSLPCTQGSQYVCPYYGYSQFGKNGTDELGILGSKGTTSTDWWDDLVKYQGTECADPAFLSSVPSEVADAMNATSSCGSYYQTSSMYPGKGPCSALYFETTEFMHRCYPVIPPAAQGAIASVGSSGLSVVPATDVSGVCTVSSRAYNKLQHATMLTALCSLCLIRYCTHIMGTKASRYTVSLQNLCANGCLAADY